MRSSKMIDWQYVIGLVLLPFLLLGIAMLTAFIQGRTRYDPAYFTQQYQDLYQNPDAVMARWEQAMQSGNAKRIQEIEGTNSGPGDIEALPAVQFVGFIGKDERYSDYLFLNWDNYHRYALHVKAHNGRYISVSEGIYYYIDSGRWVQTFIPLLVIWYVAMFLFTVGLWIYRYMAMVREQMYQDRAPRMTK